MLCYAMLKVNFDPALVQLLREVRYLHMLAKEIPATAAELNSAAEVFRVQMGNLQLIVGKYNDMLLTMLDVERPLLAAQLQEIDALLEKGLNFLTWKSLAIDEFVREAMASVQSAHGKLGVLKAGMRSVQEILAGWAASPLMVRKTTKTYSPADFTEEHSIA